jgi:hypothetical protein
MRKLALAASIALGVAAIATPSMARPWNDARMKLEVPNSGGWNVRQESYQTTSDRSYIEADAPDDDCAFYSTTAQVANASVARSAITEDERFTPEYLQGVAAMFPRVVGPNATVTANTVDTSGDWPIRRISFRSGDRVSHAAVQWRPGAQLIAACARYEGADSQASRYDSIFRSIGHPNDATWLAEAQNAASAAAAAEQAAQAAAAAEQEQDSNEPPPRDRRDRRLGRRD